MFFDLRTMSNAIFAWVESCVRLQHGGSPQFNWLFLKVYPQQKYLLRELHNSNSKVILWQCARHPELLEYPHAILYLKLRNPPNEVLDEVGQDGVPEIVSKYGMWVL